MSDYWDWLDKVQDFTDGIPYAGLPARAFFKLYKTNHSGWSALDNGYNKAKSIYNDTSLGAYEWRARHSNDYLLGHFWAKANARDLYNEQVAMQNDRKKNLGYNWKDSAYPRSAFNGAFGGSVGFANSSPLFDVNKAILDLYSGVSRW